MYAVTVDLGRYFLWEDNSVVKMRNQSRIAEIIGIK